MSRSLEELDKYLVGHWRMENNFKDSSGNGNHGTPTDIEWKPTSRGMNPKFNGSSSLIDCGSGVGVELSHTFTISMWVNMTVSNGFRFISTSDNSIWVANTNAFRLKLFDSINSGYLQRHFNSPSEHTGMRTHFVITYDGSGTSSGIKAYWNGVEQNGTDESSGTFVSMQTTAALLLGKSESLYGNGTFFDAEIYKIDFDPTETLDLYNATKEAHGVIPAERSFTHRLSPEVDSSTAFATDMHTKNASRELVDLSGNGNNGTVSGAVRSGGYFTDGMRFNGINNNVLSTIGDIIGLNDFTMHAVINSSGVTGLNAIINIEDTGWATFRIRDGLLESELNDSINPISRTVTTITGNEYHLVSVSFKRNDVDGHNLYLDGVLKDSKDPTGVGSVAASTLRLFGRGGQYYAGVSNVAYMKMSYSDNTSIINTFNSLAVLPIFSFDAADYPANDTVYTSNLPYSSMVVQSGSFSINLDNELECVSNGSITMRNSHDFDGSEYLTLDIGGVKTSDTGTVTEGTVVASITQGSNVVTIDMVAGDKLDRLDIQFRKPVE